MFQSPVGESEVLLVLGMVSDKAEGQRNRESSAWCRHSHARGLECAGWRTGSPRANSEGK